MLKRLVGWMRAAAHPNQAGDRWARWIGRTWARLTYARRVEPTWLEVTRHEVPVEGLGAELDNFRIVQMSDFHCSRHVTEDYLGRAVEMAQAESGDVIALTGDFIHKGFRHVEQVARVLGRLKAPHGVFAVLGNHDFSVRNALGLRRYRHLHRAIADALRAEGIRVLHNETVQLARGRDTLHLTGIEDLWSRVCDPDRAFAGVCPSVPRVVLAHNPATVERLDEHRCDLMLSGHTHGGQINLPGLGRVTLGPKGRRYAAGMYRLGKTQLYVNKGVGFGFRLRYNVRPEVAVLSLRPAQQVTYP